MIPQHLRPFFWDINAENFNPYSYARYTIARLLECGDEKAVAWLRETFSEAEIKEAVCSERRLSRRSANFWALVYRIPFAKVAALKPAA